MSEHSPESAPASDPRRAASRTRRIFKRLSLYLLMGTLGFVAGSALIFVRQVASGPSSELWHTTQLDAEFSLDKKDEIRTFDDYLQLEERLFAELDEKIYAHTDSGPAFELNRYSAGSAADPRQRSPNWNRTFVFPGEPSGRGVLLLHGMSDSPYSLRALGESLHQRGDTVLGLRLPGHGTAPSGLQTVTWEDMAAVVRLAVAELASRVSPDAIHIIGYSTGAPLALHYVLEQLDGVPGARPASLVLLSPSIGITAAARLAGWADWLARLPGLENLAWTPLQPEFDPFKYNSFATNAGYQVHRLTRSVATRIEQRAATGPLPLFPPTLVFLSTVDDTVSTDAVVDNLLEHLAPPGHELVLFDINRRSLASTVLVADPGPLTSRLLARSNLPFHLTLLTNQDPESSLVVRHSKPPGTATAQVEALDLEWPSDLISLSHIALPFPPDDPLYGRAEHRKSDQLHLGQVAVQGERGLLKLPADWLLRVRHNPFYDYLETRVVEWIDGPSPAAQALETAE